MNFSSLLSDHEQKAFSAFLGQLAQENRYKNHSPPSVDSTVLQHHLQHPLHQPQLSLSSSSSSLSSGEFSRTLPSITDPSSLPAQQQREWIQHVSSNPMLAPGGIIDPHAMSQAFLQNPELMAQANAITQAMVLAQQQQMQLQMQQHQQHQQQGQAILQQQHGLHGSHPHSMQHHYSQGSPPGGSYSPDQQQQYYARTITKRKSQTNLHGGSDHDVSPPPLPSNGNMHHTGPGSFSTSPNGYYEAGHAVHPHHHSQENDDDYGPPTKKLTGRKGSSANDSQRSSRDGYEGQRTDPRRKTSGSAPYDSSGRRGDYYTDNREDSEEPSFPGPIPEHRNGLGKMGEGDVMRHRQSSTGDSNARSPPSNQAQPRPSKKAPHELLTEAEKKANHIASEQKRRQNIRIGFDSLVEIVPTLSECHRSEALILQKSVDYIHRLLGEKHELKSRVRDLQANLGEPTEGEDSASDMEIEMYH